MSFIAPQQNILSRSLNSLRSNSSPSQNTLLGSYKNSILRIGMVVGEVSGDNLAADLIDHLRQYYSTILVEGILGPRLINLGYSSLFPMERLNVMGLIEPLGRIPELFRIRKHLIQHFVKNPPDIFIGVDAPDFNLGLEKKLKEQGIKTVHYVSPTVWAWRQGRIHAIKKSVDLMLCLYPFEEQFYKNHQVPVCYVGHPLADQITVEQNSIEAKKKLGLSLTQPVIAILPGSRKAELKNLAKSYLLAAKLCFEERQDLQFVAPLVSLEHEIYFKALHQEIAPELPLKTWVANPRVVIAASDVVLVTSGTATLEVMLHKKPMVVAYRMHPLTYHIAKRLVKVPYISQPNLLANELLVPEFIQNAVKPEDLAKALLERLEPNAETKKLIDRFTEIHLLLKQNGSEKASQAINQLLT